MPKKVIGLNVDGSRIEIEINELLPLPILVNPTTTTETIIAKWAIPANFLKALEGLKVCASYFGAGTGTVIWRCRIGALGTTADTLISQLTTSGAQVANSRGTSEFNLFLPTDTTCQASGFAIMQNAILGQITGALNVATIVPTNIVYISISVQVSIAAANQTLGAQLFLNA